MTKILNSKQKVTLRRPNSARHKTICSTCQSVSLFFVVAGVGLEPTHRCRYRILSPTRLPISPPGQE